MGPVSSSDVTRGPWACALMYKRPGLNSPELTRRYKYTPGFRKGQIVSSYGGIGKNYAGIKKASGLRLRPPTNYNPFLHMNNIDHTIKTRWYVRRYFRLAASPIH